ncbi:MAG: hypothetical protein JWO36_1182 [Myxococcales bacterium]|nr:hypothetical protein [Myxococcales bacterium]
MIAVPLTKQVQTGGIFREARIDVAADDIETTDARFEKANCLALSEHIRSISVERCGGTVGKVNKRIVNSIRLAVSFLLELPP